MGQNQYSHQNNNQNMMMRVIAIVFLMIINLEWFPYALFLIANFYDIDALTAFQMASIAGFFLTPIFVGFFITLAKNKVNLQKVRKCFAVLGFLSLIPIGIFLWMMNQHYFQLDINGQTFPSGISNLEPIVGMLGNFRVTLNNALFITNFLLFYVVSPSIFLYLLNTNETIKVGKDFNYAIVFGTLYFILRFGSFMDTPLRLLNVVIGLFVVSLVIWNIIIPANQEMNNNIEKDIIEEDYIENQSDCNTWINPEFRRGHLRLYLIYLGFFLSAQPISMNGMLGNSWVWVGFLTGGLINILLIKSHRQYIIKFSSALRLFIACLIDGILLLYTQLDSTLLLAQPYLILIGSCLIVVLLPNLDKIFPTKENPKVKNNKVVYGILFFIKTSFTAICFLFGIVMVFLVGVSNPISTWVTVVFISGYALIVLIKIIKDKRKKSEKSRN